MISDLKIQYVLMLWLKMVTILQICTTTATVNIIEFKSLNRLLF